MPMQQLREDLLNLLADVEAGLDFTEEDIHFIATADLLMRLARGLAYLTLLQKQIDRRALGQRPFRVVLAGKPNAGKSSLFNALVGADAALVSAEPGTTRDYLTKTITLDGVMVELVDTAGERESADRIEAEAQSLGREQARQADWTLLCVACDAPDWPEADCLEDAVTKVVATKTDLGAAPADVLATSVATGSGLDDLRSCIAQAARNSGHAALAPSLSRCRHHLNRCVQHLRNAHALVLQEEMPELLALEIRLALETLGEIAGAVYTNDLLDRIFSRFCIGK
jgi:tRNA modification GTPase